MTKPSMEPEQAIAELRVMGCPYDAMDPRTTAWLEGHMSGWKAAQAEFERIQNESLAQELKRIARG